MTSPASATTGRTPATRTTGGREVRDAPGLLLRCQQRIRAVLPVAPTGFEDLQQAISAHRGRRISVAFTDPGDEVALPAGVWLAYPNHDLVWVDRRHSPMMRIVAACHEFGHIISGHQPATVDPVTTGRSSEPDRRAGCDPREKAVRELAHDRLGLPDAAITAIMMRCGEPHEPGSWHWHEEREAELVGRLLAARVLRHPRGLAQALTDHP